MIWGLIIGLLLGIGLCLWQNYRLKCELKKILQFSPDIQALIPSLSVASLVNRELSYINKRYQQQQETLKAWKEILEQAPVGFLWIDEENQLLWCNQQARQLLQIDRWQPDQVRLLLELVRSYELDQLIETTRNHQTPQIQEWLYYPSAYPLEENNTDDLNYLTTNIPTQLSQGTLPAIALKGYGYPLSQREIGVFIENQQPLKELSRSRDRAFSDLTHELRTPLTSISLLAETLQRRLHPPESRWAQQISQEVERLISLIQEWLDLSQLDADPSQYLHLESLSVQNLVETAWKTLEPLAQEKAVTLNYQDREHLRVEGDRSRLIQVILNILDNSIKHSPSHAEIFVKTSQKDAKFLKIDFIDQGTGFSQKDIPYIFERLYRGEASRTRQKQPHQTSLRQGSGLGLAIVQQIIQAHGGSIKAQNHPELKGAWLQVILPLSQ